MNNILYKKKELMLIECIKNIRVIEMEKGNYLFEVKLPSKMIQGLWCLVDDPASGDKKIKRATLKWINDKITNGNEFSNYPELHEIWNRNLL